jgi:hypothetical protein
VPVIPITELSDPRLADYSHQTDVALKKARSSEHGLYLAESALVLQRALRAGHVPRSVLALGASVEEALSLVGDDVPIFSGPPELLEELTGYLLHRGLIASLHRPALPSVESLLKDARRVASDERDIVGYALVGIYADGAPFSCCRTAFKDVIFNRHMFVGMATELIRDDLITFETGRDIVNRANGFEE